MRSVVMIGVLWSAGAVAEPPREDAIATGARVLVWHDATLYVGADKAETLRVTTLPRPRAQSTGSVMEMEVIADHGEYLQVRPSLSTCETWGSLTIDGRLDEVALHVRRADLAPVLVKPWSQTYKDGTNITLAPGVPLSVANKPRTIALSLTGGKQPARIAVDVPDDAVGLSFAPAEESRPTRYTRPGAWEITTRTVTLGGKRVTFDRGLPLLEDAPPTRGNKAVFAYDFGCAAVEVIVGKAQVRRYRPGAGSAGVMLGSGFDRRAPTDEGTSTVIPKGTLLSTASGKHVAFARFDIETTDRCFDALFTIDGRFRDPKAKLRVCADASALVTR